MLATIKNIKNDFIIWFGNFIINKIPFHFIRLMFYRYFMNFKIGKRSTIHLGCTFTSLDKFILGNDSTINQFCSLDNRGHIEIGNSVSISPHVKIITANHRLRNYSSFSQISMDKIVIEDFCFLGYDSMILQGVVCTHGSVIGAKSVVTRSTEKNSIYFGVPAKLFGYRDEDSVYFARYERWFH